jgi:hypothetical protein
LGAERLEPRSGIQGAAETRCKAYETVVGERDCWNNAETLLKNG